MSEETRGEIRRIWESQEEQLARLVQDPKGYLEEIGEDLDEDAIGVFLSNDVLEVKREQYLSNGGEGWITNFYILVTGTGGPHVEFTTGYHIHVYWGGEVRESSTYDDHAREAIDRIEEYLKEAYGDEA